MYKQVEKPKENKSRAVANSVAQKKGNGKQGFGFVDNRPERLSQRRQIIQLQQAVIQRVITRDDITFQATPHFNDMVTAERMFLPINSDQLKEKVRVLWQNYDGWTELNNGDYMYNLGYYKTKNRNPNYKGSRPLKPEKKNWSIIVRKRVNNQKDEKLFIKHYGPFGYTKEIEKKRKTVKIKTKVKKPYVYDEKDFPEMNFK